MVSASIIIPTYNRLDILKLVLLSLESQTFAGEKFEIIVSDDGSKDGTGEFLKSYRRTSNGRFLFILAEKNSGPARARNLAIAKASGEIIIIIGDDIEVAPSFVAGHVSWHREHKDPREAVLGHVSWPESIQPSRFMRWLYYGGRRFFFNYAQFNTGQRIASQNLYTCNVSVKKSLLAKTTLFDESFPFASHEDLELGERLGRRGMKLFYEKSLIGYHHHFMQVENIARRVYLMGRSADLFWQKIHDDAGVVKKRLRTLCAIFASIPGFCEVLIKLLSLPEKLDREYPVRWQMILTMSFWLGYADARRNKEIRMLSIRK